MDSYRFATRLNSFTRIATEPNIIGLLRAASQVPGLNATELNYPQHFISVSRGDLASALTETRLVPTAINLRFEGPQFALGTLTQPAEVSRSEAIRTVIGAIEAAHELGADHVILWLSDDGWDYPFQVDYPRLWRDAIAGIQTIADHAAHHAPGVRVSIEYKPSDPRRASLVRGMMDTLLLIADVARDNVGVTIDVCHSLMAGEHPPAAAALALARGKLFGVHLNDGYGVADDGLSVASVHEAMTLELLLVLRRGGYKGTIYFDTFPNRVDPVAECAANIQTVKRLLSVLDRLDHEALTDAQARHDALTALATIRGLSEVR